MAFDFPTSPTIGQVYQSYTWDGEKWVLTFAANAAGLIAIKVFTTSGPYVPSPNMTSCIVEAVGGGGAGGSAPVGTATTSSAGSGGGYGGFTRKTISAAVIGASQPITIGAGGVPGAAGNFPGGSGGTTSFGALCSATGGAGGPSANAGAVASNPGAAGGAGVGGDFNAVGAPGGGSAVYSGGGIAAAMSGYGGSGPYGGGGLPQSNAAGQAGAGFGAGGSGAASFQTTLGNLQGGAGAPGVVIITEFGLIANAAPSGAVVLRNYLSGLTLATAGATSTFTVAAGVAADSTNADLIALPSSIAKTYGPWSLGSGNGALDTGAAAVNTWYHVYLIKRPDTGAVEVATSLSASAPTFGVNIPAAYTLSRRIGAMKINATSAWAKFTQTGDTFIWETPVQIGAGPGTIPNPGTAAVTRTAETPPGIVTRAIMSILGATTNASTDSPGAILLSDLAMADIAPGPNNFSFYCYSAATTGFQLGAIAEVNTNTSSQFRSRLQLSAANTNLYLSTVGWKDARGRDA
ncbi:glycine-rich domain-containing protein [Bradyrhizobium sp. CCBAU 21362]|uniref:glycine-rich domain-containing protein n=1 Tax=Bradyrhizobium sp. CCBAU 21362 TaxID=1325082 RepID=UPI002306B83E|nr:hypothetical protein [Bradyrhizobium sp. CCBAU 21362]